MKKWMMFLIVLMLPSIVHAAPALSIERFGGDTTSVVIAGNTLTDSVITVVHEPGRVLVNNYQVYPRVPRGGAAPVTQLSDVELRHRQLIVAAATAKSTQESIAILRQSADVDSAWADGTTLSFRWKGQSVSHPIYRSAASTTPTDRSQEFFDELVGFLHERSSVYIGDYLVQFPICQRALERRIGQLAATSVGGDPENQKYAQVIRDLRAPRDLNELKVR